MESAQLHVLVGPPGGGKTSYAQANFPADWIVSGDDMREALSKWRRDDPVATYKYVAPVRREIALAISRAIQTRLKQGLQTVYDNTNLLQHNRRSLLKLVPPKVRVRYVILDRPLEAKMADRGWRPARLIEQQHTAFQAELPNILAGDGSRIVTVEDRRTV